jgi:radical SAM-linked protein
MAYSAGFSPHPKISYANAAPTGVASEAEYVEIGVVQFVDPDKLLVVLDEVLPPGLDILAVVEARTPDFVARLEASHWSLELPGTSQETLQGALDAFMSESEVLVDRMTKSGIRTFDARTAVIRANVEMGSDCAILQVVVRHGVPAVRPDDVLAALKKVADFAQEIPPRVTRLAQGPLLEDGWSVGDPFTLDREATQA